MTEEELLERWAAERPIYEAWGHYVIEQVSARLVDKLPKVGIDIFIRIPPKYRLKDDFSFVEKAFYRKAYDDPYTQITDKVGTRFVVLLGTDVPVVGEAITSVETWKASKDRDPEEEANENPIQFDYKALHFVVRNIAELEAEGVTIPPGTPCEIQVKTLLQHAYSELTHDTIYKPSVTKTPQMMRAAAKSMALLESTNDYFESVVEQVEAAILPEREATALLREIYEAGVGRPAQPSRVEGLLLDALLPEQSYAESLSQFLSERRYVFERVNEHASMKLLFRQPSILLVYFLAATTPANLVRKWPLTRDELTPVFTDLGLAIPG